MPAANDLLKDVGCSELVEPIRSVYAGRKVINPDIASRLAEHVASETPTPRQHEVLECLAKDKSNQEVAEPLFISESTVKAHGEAILSKLEARDRTRATHRPHRSPFTVHRPCRFPRQERAGVPARRDRHKSAHCPASAISRSG